ncbi:hypothetical protein [Butyricicoccus sp. OF27-2pH9A]|uniref:hypothetical protein n=1 Tax=Butyricicoccus sp. OF27-2pH9A TaxID=3002517 RepID=UPI0022DF2A4E|nr:hypothetical protein [Butyricicoccus sp. OF27-2pH9A]
MSKKRTIAIAAGLSALMMACAGAANTATATPTGNAIYVDGTKVNGAAYMINSNNYFKLRDIAAMVNGSAKQFEVSWNQAAKRIDLTTNKAYTVVGGELALPSATTKTAKESTAVVYKDGAKVNYTGYTIADNNYYKLRDLCKDMDIGVKYDNATKRVDILTTVGYGKEEDATTPVNPTPTEPTTPEQPSTTKPTTPSTPSTPSKDEREQYIAGDLRQEGDPGIISANCGSASDPTYYYFPSYGRYTKDYQNYLDSCNEEIVTKTIHYHTYCTQTKEKDLSGFPVEVVVADTSITKGEKLAHALMLYIDSPSGSFDLKMPKSFYERTMNGEWVFRIKGAITENTGMQTAINGNVYEISGAKINGSDVRESKPTSVRLELRRRSYTQ